MTTAEQVRCLRCGRILTAQASISRGYGRTCRARITAAAETADLAAFKAEQVDKATEAIADGGVIPTSRPAVYAVSSSHGTLVYITDAYSQTCSCKKPGRTAGGAGTWPRRWSWRPQRRQGGPHDRRRHRRPG